MTITINKLVGKNLSDEERTFVKKVIEEAERHMPKSVCFDNEARENWLNQNPWLNQVLTQRLRL